MVTNRFGPPPADPLLSEGCCTVREAVQLTGIPRATLYDLIRRGDLPHVRIGSRKKIPRLALRLFMAERVRHGG